MQESMKLLRERGNLELQSLMQYGFITLICAYTARAVTNILLVNLEIWQGLKAMRKGAEIKNPAEAQQFIETVKGKLGRFLKRYSFLVRRSGQVVMPGDFFDNVISDDIRNEWTGQRNRLILLGLLGTFTGLSFAVYEIAIESGDIASTMASIAAAQEGMKTAFTTSIVGIIGALIVGVLMDFSLRRDQRLGEAIDEFCIYKVMGYFLPKPPGAEKAMQNLPKPIGAEEGGN
jgi:hypothetical protein